MRYGFINGIFDWKLIIVLGIIQSSQIIYCTIRID